MPEGLGEAVPAVLLHPLADDISRAAAAALASDAREGLAAHWRRRAASERRIGVGFTQIAARLRDLSAPSELVRWAERSADEEAAHADLCWRLVAFYGGADEPPARSPAVEVPEFGTGDPRLELALLILGTCCINETLATAYLSLCLDLATVPFAAQANRVHLREEIQHGRLGWALLASSWLDADLRRALVPCLSGMLAANVPLWLRPDPFVPSEGLPAFGHPSHPVQCEAIRRAVEEVVIPGFAHVGLDVSHIRRPWGTQARTRTSTSPGD